VLCIINKIKIVIDDEILEKYNKYYFSKYLRRRKIPIEKPIPPSLNKWIVMPRFQANNEKQKWKEFMIWLVNENNLNDKKLKNCIITYAYYFPTKHRHDSDNYSGKFINDGLVEGNLLEDDDFEHVEMRYKGFYDKNNPRTEIIIENIGGF
jgi:hypothetical protein